MNKTIKTTFSPRSPSYVPDGLGRDMYINYNNGGLLKDKKMNAISSENYNFSPAKRFYSLT